MSIATRGECGVGVRGKELTAVDKELAFVLQPQLLVFRLFQ